MMMRNVFTLMLMLPICSVLSANGNSPSTASGIDPLANDRSFIHTQRMLSAKADSILQEFQYFDGLGKPIQTVSQGISPTRGDLVTTLEYDTRGRILRQWLPLHVQDNNGAFVSAPFNAIAKQYKDYAPFQYMEYDYLPESRIVLQQDPGEAWEMNPVHRQYLTNDATGVLSCLRYKIDDGKTLFEDGIYEPGELRVLQYTDEDGKTAYSFIDKVDRILLTREMDGAKQHDTYHVYDTKGNLCYVLPPMYQENKDLNLYAYQYSFDNRDRCIMKKLPGGDVNRFAYDKGDRLVYSQNGRQSQQKEWMFTVLDKRGREAITGIGVSSSTNVPLISNTLVCAQRTKGAGNMNSGYTISNLTGVTNTRPEVVNYYDSYDFLSDYESKATCLHLEYNFKDFPSWLKDKENTFSTDSVYPLGLQTGKRVYLEDGKYLLSSSYYDKKGRMAQQRSTNHLGGYDVNFYSYTFTGLVKGTVHMQLDATAKTVVAEYYDYVYDCGERLKQVIYQLNGGKRMVLSENEYDNLCRLNSLKLNNGTTVLGYDYNIRDWLTAIDSQYFKQKLHYTDGKGTPCYNGNISSMTWQTASSSILGYKYGYDGLNRMTEAIYGEGDNLNVNLNRFNEQVTGYDKNGNILGLKRFGQTSQSAYGLIDNLSMSYNGNRLLAVKDNAVASKVAGNFDFQDGANKSEEYIYDLSGNLIKDLNKKITDIQYNSLNLPCRIMFENGSSISYLYSPEGIKLRTTHIIAGVTTTTDYCGNVIYENGSPKTLMTDAGFVSLTDNKFHYYLKDYEGNHRVVVNEKGEVEERNDYYPLGGLMASSSGSVQPYKYNGKELDRKGGLDWYDYGARHYDAVLGRWHTVDPMAEQYYSLSPYAYCANNPIKHIDPDGRTIYIWYMNDSGTKVAYKYSGGNVTHSNPFVQAVITAYQYNKANGIKAGNGGGASTVAIVENTDIRVNVSETVYEVTYSPNASRGVGCIYWKSDLGRQNANGTVNSPATIFDHEADHALQHKTNAAEYEVNRVRDSDPQYGTKEERRVITGSEQKTSRANGETRPGQVTRRNHEGKPVITKGVTSNKIDRLKTQEYENERKERPVWTSEY